MVLNVKEILSDNAFYCFRSLQLRGKERPDTQEELRIAFEEYENGTFIKHKKGWSEKNRLTSGKRIVIRKPLFFGRIVMERVRTIVNPVQIAIISGIIIPYDIGVG